MPNGTQSDDDAMEKLESLMSRLQKQRVKREKADERKHPRILKAYLFIGGSENDREAECRERCEQFPSLTFHAKFMNENETGILLTNKSVAGYFEQQIRSEANKQGNVIYLPDSSFISRRQMR